LNHYTRAGSCGNSRALNLKEIKDDNGELIVICVKELKTSVVIPKLHLYLADWKIRNLGVDPNSVRH
jgi:hypothetical protein